MSQANVFEQVIKHISRLDFERSAVRHGADHGLRQLDSWTWFGALLFGQLTGHESLRAIERVFSQGNRRMQRLGFSTVCRSTLSDANQVRSLGILQDVFSATLKRAQWHCPGPHRFGFDGKVLALDSSVIELCLSLSPWASYRRGKEAVKLHTAIDLAGDLPEFFVVTEDRRNDIPVAREHFGTSLHAVKAQIYVALIAYLLVQIIRWATKSQISMSDAMAAIGTLLLL